MNQQQQRRGQPNPGIGQPRPPRPGVSKKFSRKPDEKYEDEERYMKGKEPAESNITQDEDEGIPARLRRGFRERRMMNDGPEDRMKPEPRMTPKPTMPPPSRSPMGMPTPRPTPGPMPTPTEPNQSPKQSSLRSRMRRRFG